MIKLVFIFIILTSLSLGLSWLNDNPGELSFLWLGYNIETSLTFAVMVLILAVFIIYFIYNTFASIFGLPNFFRKRAQKNYIDRSLKNISDGYMSLISGDIDSAKKANERLLKLGKAQNQQNPEIEKISKVLEAKIAQEEGNLLIANSVYKELLEDKKNEFFATKGLLDSAFIEGDVEKSIKYAEDAYRLKPDLPNGAHSLLELYKKTGNWNKANEFLGKYKKRHIFKADKFNDIDIKKEFAEIWYNKALVLRSNESDNSFTKDQEAFNLLDKANNYAPTDKKVILETINIGKNINKSKTIRNIVFKFWHSEQDYTILEAYINSITDRSSKATMKKKLKELEQLEKVQADKSIELIREALIKTNLEIGE